MTLITNIETVAIYVNSQDEAEKFWVDTLGFELILKEEMVPGVFWLEVAANKNRQTKFVLYSKSMMEKQNPKLAFHPSIVFTVENIEDFQKDLNAKDVEVGEIRELPFGKMLEFNDQDGNLYMVKEGR